MKNKQWSDKGLEHYHPIFNIEKGNNLCEIAIVIGRFQGLHNGHLHLITEAYQNCEHLVIVIGSARTGRDPFSNPFTFEERSEVLISALGGIGIPSENYTIIPVGDHIYNNTAWIVEVQTKVEMLCQKLYDKTSEATDVKLYGYYKDKTSFYLNIFPDWKPVLFGDTKFKISATDIRESYFSKLSGSTKAGVKEKFEYLMPKATLNFLTEFGLTKEYNDLYYEYEFTIGYRKPYESMPFPVFFSTVDSVVVNNGHVLLVKRKSKPGKGKWAMPGGFIKPMEDIHDAGVRELVEETCIQVDTRILENSIRYERVFGHPSRSNRGRIITLAKLFVLKFKQLPLVKGADDAEKAEWKAIKDLPSMESEFFEDHYHIIKYLLAYVD